MVAVHTLDGIAARELDRRGRARAVAPGTPVRLRLINTDSAPAAASTSAGRRFAWSRSTAPTSSGPTPLSGTTLVLAAGGRYDVAFTMPATPVQLAVEDTLVGLVLSATGRPTRPAVTPGPSSIPPSTARPGRRRRSTPRATSTASSGSTWDRKPGFFDGQPGMQWTINGGIFPRVPMFMVERGDLVRVSIKNTTGAVHPMHLHGHHMLVLSRNGEPVTGSPWWSDTLNVEPDERYEVAFRADNPGIWMDHCHNLSHAAAGLTMHVAYVGVTTPFETGGARTTTRNRREGETASCLPLTPPSIRPRACRGRTAPVSSAAAAAPGVVHDPERARRRSAAR